MRICTWDLETSIADELLGPDPRSPKNDFYTLIWGNTPDNVKIKHNEMGFKRELDDAKDELLSADLIVGQNLPFDLGYIIHHFVERGKLPDVFDCQIAEYLMSGQRHSFASLEELQLIYLGVKVKKSRISALYKKGIGADKILAARHRCKRVFALYEQYCYDDGITTLQVFKRQYQKAQQLGMLNVIRAYNQYMVALTIIMHTGIMLDVPGTEKTIREFELIVLEKLAESTKLVKTYWNDPLLPEFNINSSAHKSALLFGGDIEVSVKEQVGYFKPKPIKEVVPWTDDQLKYIAKSLETDPEAYFMPKMKVIGWEDPKPKFKTFKKVIHVSGMGLPTSLTQEGKIKGRYETGRAIISNIKNHTKNKDIQQYCSLQLESMNYKKIISTYLKAFLKYEISGYVYPKFNNTAVITGRLSSSGGINFQNIPASGPMFVKVQRLFIAPKGFICCSIDWSQLEMYIAAWNSKDSALKNDLLGNLDFHCQSLSFAEQSSYEDIYNKAKVLKLEEYEYKRKKAKPITFQKTYGASFKRVAKETGLEESVVERVFNAMDAKYWKLKAFNDHVYQSISLNKKVSLSKHVPNSQKGKTKDSRRFNELGQELLPIMQGDNKYFSPEYIREVGYYQMPHGKLYSFEEYANLNDRGVRRGFSMPQAKNYTCQGGAADVVACVTIEIMNYALKYKDEIKVINTVHDSLMFYIKEDKKALHVPALCGIMVRVPKALKKWLNVDLDFDFAVEAKIGSDFGHLEVYNG
jgi:DNA polymerase I-like protein with 3'-5' exonuclease and polymerase domains